MKKNAFTLVEVVLTLAVASVTLVTLFQIIIKIVIKPEIQQQLKQLFLKIYNEPLNSFLQKQSVNRISKFIKCSHI